MLLVIVSFSGHYYLARYNFLEIGGSEYDPSQRIICEFHFSELEFLLWLEFYWDCFNLLCHVNYSFEEIAVCEIQCRSIVSYQSRVVSWAMRIVSHATRIVSRMRITEAVILA